MSHTNTEGQRVTFKEYMYHFSVTYQYWRSMNHFQGHKHTCIVWVSHTNTEGQWVTFKVTDTHDIIWVSHTNTEGQWITIKVTAWVSHFKVWVTIKVKGQCVYPYNERDTVDPYLSGDLRSQDDRTDNWIFR